MAFQEFDGDLDEPTSFVPFEGELDAPEGDDKVKYSDYLSPDIPLGLLETVTTGAINDLGGIASGVAGSLVGMAHPDMTAKEGWDKASQLWAEYPGKVLSPQTKSGKAIEKMMEDAIGSFKEYAAEQGPQDILGAVPFVGDELASDERVAGTLAAAGVAMPELMAVIPGLVAKGKPAVRSKVKPVEEVLSEIKTDAIKAQAEADARPNLTSLEGPDGQMSLFDQADLMGQRSQFNAGNLGDWRIDENGMPVRVDLSQEALNLEAPLQRNLWGDELGPALEQGRSLTEAIDATPANGMWAQRRGMINRLGGRGQELIADPALEAAMMRAEGPGFPDAEPAFQPTNPLPTQRLGDIDPSVPRVEVRGTSETPPGGSGGPSGPLFESGTGYDAPPLPQGYDRPTPPDTVKAPVSPENIAKKQELRRASDHLPNAVKKISEYDTVNTVEEATALALAPDAKDLTPSLGRRALSSGPNQVAVMSNNPIVKFLRTSIENARTDAKLYIDRYVTSKDGLGRTWKRLPEEDRISTMKALKEFDRNQVDPTPEIMSRMGLNEQQQHFINTWHNAAKEMLDRQNQALVAMGKAPIERRPGYFPSVFQGAYKTLVLDKNGKAVTWITSDSAWQRDRVKKQMGKDYVYKDMPRQWLSSMHNQSDYFSGMNDVLNFLSKHDPRFAEVTQMVKEAMDGQTNKLFAFNVHELSKKGIKGSQGDKPWLTAKENTSDMYKAMIRYLEDGAEYTALQKPLNDLKSLALNPELQEKQPNALKYVDSQIRHVEGKSSQNLVGKSLNNLVDLFPAALRYGSRKPIEWAGFTKNKISQHFMGWWNPGFVATQLIQPLQTAMPTMLDIGTKLAGPNGAAQAPLSMTKGYGQFVQGLTQLLSGKDFGASPKTMELIKYAQDKGLLSFSELERMHEGEKSKVGRAYDAAAEAGMKFGEFGSRTPAFMGFADLISTLAPDLPTSKVAEIAYNATQYSMVDYHKWNRPHVYAKMGVVGQFAGGLTTFKHAFIGQQLKHMKELGNKNPAPFAYSAMMALALGGLMGLPGMDELESIYSTISEKAFGKRSTIRDAVAENAPRWAQYGALSEATGTAWHSKFSAANMIPDLDRPIAAISPQGSKVVDIIVAAIDAVKHKDEEGFRNLMLQLSPSGALGEVEHRVAREGDALIGKDGNVSIVRTPEEWDSRRLTGMRSLRELREKEDNYYARRAQRADTEARRELIEEAKRKARNQNLTPEELVRIARETAERKGTPESILNAVVQQAQNRNLTEKQRLEGTPSGSLSSIYRYEYYNKPGER